MPLQKQTVEVLLKGLAQKTDAKFTVPGELVRAENVVFDKQGALSKRRGYRRKVFNTNTIANVTSEAVHTSVNVVRDELVVTGIDSLWSVASRTDVIDSVGVVRRGPMPRGMLECDEIASQRPTVDDEYSSTGDNPTDDNLREADVASLTTLGVTYYCYVWRNHAQKTIEAAIWAEQEAGNRVLISQEIVYAASDTVDCPRVCTVGTDTFVLHCIETDTTANASLVRYSFSISSLAATTTWTSNSTQVIHVAGLYDVSNVEGSNDFLICWLSGATSITIRRYSSSDLAWGGYIWTTTTAVASLDFRVLACFAHNTTGYVVVGYQDSAGTRPLVIRNYLWSNGSTVGATATFGSQVLGEFVGARHHTALGFAYISADTYAVVAELSDADHATLTEQKMRIVWYQSFDPTTTGPSEVSNEQWVKNVSLQSKPFGHASGANLTGTTRNIYAVLGFHSMRITNIVTGSVTSPDNENYDGPGYWDQPYAFVCNLDRASWGQANGTIRPYICAQMRRYSMRMMVHGKAPYSGTQLGAENENYNHQRINHLPHVVGPTDYGPNTKTRTFPMRVHSRFDGDKPSGVILMGYKFHLEEPWVYHRDVADPGQPAEDLAYPYPFAQHKMVGAGAGGFASGGCGVSYDGRQPVETNFPWYPEIISIADVDISEGTLSTVGDHIYVAVYAWRDNRGQLHRSRPSKPLAVNIASGTDNRSVNLAVRCVNLSLKDNTRHYPDASEIGIEIYHALPADPTTFYRIVDGFAMLNDPDEYYVTFTDSVPETTALVNREPLGFSLSGGDWVPLPPEPPVASSTCAIWQNRVWLASSECPNEIHYSTEILPEPGGEQYTAPEFSPVNVFRIDGIGRITALQAMDTVMVVFTRDGIYALSGQGTDFNGLNATLSLQVLAQGTGCLCPRSVVLGPPGIFFQSAKGYYLLSRSYELDYLGAGASVEDDVRVAGIIRSAALLEDRHEIRLVTNDAVSGACRVLVYDYLQKLWSKAALPNGSSDAWQSSANDGCAWRGSDGEILHVVLQQGTLQIERSANDSSTYSDQNSGGTNIAITATVQTGWIHLAGVAGFKRLYELGIQLTKTQNSAVSVTIDYDLDGSYTNTTTQTVSWTSPAPQYLRIKPNVQKCTAIRVLITETGSIPLTENLRIHSLTLEVGMKTGPRRVPDTQIGT